MQDKASARAPVWMIATGLRHLAWRVFGLAAQAPKRCRHSVQRNGLRKVAAVQRSAALSHQRLKTTLYDWQRLHRTD